MHFSVEKSGKEVGSGQRFSHLKCIEFITYSQTTAATPPRHLLQPWLPIFFLGGIAFSHALALFRSPLPTFYIVNKARNQAMMERDIELEYRGMKSRGYTTFHYLSSISHRIVFYRPLLWISPFDPPVFPFALFDESRKSFSRFKFKFNRKYLRYLHLAWWLPELIFLKI